MYSFSNSLQMHYLQDKFPPSFVIEDLQIFLLYDHKLYLNFLTH